MSVPVANRRLKNARLHAHMSQDELARRIREGGFGAGEVNGCTREMIAKWESGRVRQPQPRYLVQLEQIFAMPAASLGFEDPGPAMERARAEAGPVRPLPDPKSRYGPLSGIWLSEYQYPSSSRGGDYMGRHYVLLLQRGAVLTVTGVPASKSLLTMNMEANGQVVTGTWAERTRLDGFYKGATYFGAIQMLQEPTGRRMDGAWVGFGRDRSVNTGSWRLELVEDSLADDAQERWNLAIDPEDDSQ